MEGGEAAGAGRRETPAADGWGGRDGATPSPHAIAPRHRPTQPRSPPHAASSPGRGVKGRRGPGWGEAWGPSVPRAPARAHPRGPKATQPLPALPQRFALPPCALRRVREVDSLRLPACLRTGVFPPVLPPGEAGGNRGAVVPPDAWASLLPHESLSQALLEACKRPMGTDGVKLEALSHQEQDKVSPNPSPPSQSGSGSSGRGFLRQEFAVEGTGRAKASSPR